MDRETFQMLAVLASGATDARGILERIERTAGAGRGPAVPTLYRRLSECVERGWIELVGAAGAAGRQRGRPGQRYRITRAGRAAARAEALRSRQFARLLLGEERGGG